MIRAPAVGVCVVCLALSGCRDTFTDPEPASDDGETAGSSSTSASESTTGDGDGDSGDGDGDSGDGDGCVAEICNGQDDDCDGLIDEFDPASNTECTVEIPAGTFSMGCAAADANCDADESPLHAVTLSAYRIDVNEVTQAAYSECVTDGPCTVPIGMYDPVNSPDRPVVNVTHDQAQIYCVWRGGALPTEAQWERAARGDAGTPIFPWGDASPTCDRAVYLTCSVLPENVGARPAGASPFGALDMAGNVSEWVADWYDPNYYDTSPSMDPSGPGSGTLRVDRGGSFAGVAANQRVSRRSQVLANGEANSRGFRCAFP